MKKLLVPFVLVLALTCVASAQAIQANLSGATSPIWQTNGVVWGLHVANGIVYAGGDFSAVRPPGAAPGTNETNRGRFAAFDANTGDLLPLQHDLD